MANLEIPKKLIIGKSGFNWLKLEVTFLLIRFRHNLILLILFIWQTQQLRKEYLSQFENWRSIEIEESRILKCEEAMVFD